MENEFLAVNREILQVVEEWESVLQQLDSDLIRTKRNKQNRTIKQILGHLIDSVSNNTHRIIQFHYQPDPMIFPDYANCGNNDKWIAIQNYQAYPSHLHLHMNEIKELISSSTPDN